MIRLRNNIVIKIISIVLVLVFSFEQIAWAEHIDLHDEPGPADYLINIGMGIIQVAFVNPAWTVIETVVITYLIPQIAHLIVNALHIDNKTLAFILEVGLTVLMTAGFESTVVAPRITKQMAENVAKKSAEIATEASKEMARNGGQQISKDVFKNIIIDKLTPVLGKNGAVKVAERVLKDINVAVIEEGMLSKLMPIIFKEAFKQSIINTAASKLALLKRLQSGNMAEKAAEEMYEQISRELAVKYGISVANLSTDAVVNELLKPGNLVQQAGKTTFTQKIGNFFSGVKDSFLSLKKIFSNKSLYTGFARPWSFALIKATEAMAFAAFSRIIYNKLKNSIGDSMAYFISGMGGMLFSFSLSLGLEKLTGITPEGFKITDMKLLNELIKRQMDIFKSRFLVAMVCEGAMSLAGEKYRDLGIVLSAGASSILGPYVARRLNPYQQQEEIKEINKEILLYEEELAKLNTKFEENGVLSPEEQQLKQVYEALIRNGERQRAMLEISFKEAFFEGLKKGIISLIVMKATDKLTKSPYLSPLDVSWFMAGLTGFMQGFFVKSQNIFALPIDKMVANPEELDGSIKSMLTTPENMLKARMMLGYELMRASLTGAYTDWASMGRGEPVISYKDGTPVWGIELTKPMDVFYYRRLANYIETLNKDGMPSAMADQLTSSLHAQAVNNIYDAVSGNIQKPYVLLLSSKAIQDRTTNQNNILEENHKQMLKLGKILKEQIAALQKQNKEKLGEIMEKLNKIMEKLNNLEKINPKDIDKIIEEENIPTELKETLKALLPVAEIEQSVSRDKNILRLYAFREPFKELKEIYSEYAKKQEIGALSKIEQEIFNALKGPLQKGINDFDKEKILFHGRGAVWGILESSMDTQDKLRNTIDDRIIEVSHPVSSLETLPNNNVPTQPPERASLDYPLEPQANLSQSSLPTSTLAQPKIDNKLPAVTNPAPETTLPNQPANNLPAPAKNKLNPEQQKFLKYLENIDTSQMSREELEALAKEIDRVFNYNDKNDKNNIYDEKMNKINAIEKQLNIKEGIIKKEIDNINSQINTITNNINTINKKKN